MKIKQFTFNPFGVNTYLVYNSSSKDTVLMDCPNHTPQETQTLVDFITANGLKLHAILLTHLHVDHVLGLNALLEQIDVPLYANSNDSMLYHNAKEHGSMFGLNVPDSLPEIHHQVNDGDTLTFGALEFDAIHVPGHSPGSICYLIKDLQSIMVGDVLFAGSIGRTDLMGGNHDQLIEGIKSKLFQLPENTVVYPGHGPATSIESEQQSNPFLR